MKDAIDLLNQRIAELEEAGHATLLREVEKDKRIAHLEAVINQQAKTYEQFQEACYERDRYKDAWERGNDLIEAMEEVKNKQLVRMAELEAENERLSRQEMHPKVKKMLDDARAENLRLLAENEQLRKKVAIGHTIEREIYENAERYRLARKHNPGMLIAIAYGISNKACGYGVDGVDAAYDAAMEGSDERPMEKKQAHR